MSTPHPWHYDEYPRLDTLGFTLSPLLLMLPAWLIVVVVGIVAYVFRGELSPWRL